MRKKLSGGMIKAIILLLMIFLYSGCENYEGFKRITIQDIRIGSFKIPKDWFNSNIDEWEYIKYSNSDNNLIAVQYSYGGNYYRDLTNYDERVFNPFFSEYEYIKDDIIKIFSNSVFIGKQSFNNNNEQITYLYIDFPCIIRNSSPYSFRILFIDNNVTEETLFKIAKSYKYKR